MNYDFKDFDKKPQKADEPPPAAEPVSPAPCPWFYAEPGGARPAER